MDFFNDLPEVCQIISAISEALSAIRESESFKNMISIILSIGNYLNHGTNKGNAQGFSLNILSQLNSIKGCDKNKTPLMYFILKSLKDRSELNYITEFESCQKASKYEISDLDLKLSEFNKGFLLMDKAKTEANTKQDIKELKIFSNQIDAFLSSSSQQFEELKKAVSDVKKFFEQTLEYYGEDKNTKATEFFKKFTNFAEISKKADEEMSIQKGKQEMQKIAMAKKMAAQTPAVKKEFSAAIRKTVRMSVRNMIQGNKNIR